MDRAVHKFEKRTEQYLDNLAKGVSKVSEIVSSKNDSEGK